MRRRAAVHHRPCFEVEVGEVYPSSGDAQTAARFDRDASHGKAVGIGHRLAARGDHHAVFYRRSCGNSEDAARERDARCRDARVEVDRSSAPQRTADDAARQRVEHHAVQRDVSCRTARTEGEIPISGKRTADETASRHTERSARLHGDVRSRAAGSDNQCTAVAHGRSRCGKTFLDREFFEPPVIVFQHHVVSDAVGDVEVAVDHVVSADAPVLDVSCGDLGVAAAHGQIDRRAVDVKRAHGRVQIVNICSGGGHETAVGYGQGDVTRRAVVFQADVSVADGGAGDARSVEELHAVGDVDVVKHAARCPSTGVGGPGALRDTDIAAVEVRRRAASHHRSGFEGEVGEFDAVDVGVQRAARGDRPVDEIHAIGDVRRTAGTHGYAGISRSGSLQGEYPVIRVGHISFVGDHIIASTGGQRCGFSDLVTHVKTPYVD